LANKKNKDLNEIAKLEKAIKEKYGSDAITNPKSLWDKQKEEEHLKQLRGFYKKSSKIKTICKEGSFTLREKKKRTPNQRTCPVCEVYSFDMKDDVYMGRYECCFKCYIDYVEGREERWKTGWRPNN